MIPTNPCSACWSEMPPDRAGWLCTDCANDINNQNQENHHE